ncbi:hypothetical protein [Campylobacter troglodytis]|nr:hypothetical protein [Campylobacter troglodytis]
MRNKCGCKAGRKGFFVFLKLCSRGLLNLNLPNLKAQRKFLSLT